ncbi:hypothetical protein DOY81_013658 [Sarcophaga bullata]|nr:hypothetical protein DOY81_013658 [Sarcophaga bullata]
MDLYTEPINERETNLTATPYAVTTPSARRYQSPYRPLQYATPMRHNNAIQQRQLPDVLQQQRQQNNTVTPSTSSSSNRKIAQDVLQG